ncbi:MAG: glutamine-hydrolyzing GMP synthase, partial [Candidatus Bipolaricaulota bacterium]|nr:glutamine-hydrolyzing GMP synthase [Candidatus Bipolaricaulota bacterium]
MGVVILDFGSQYTRLIARRVRELAVYSVILPGTAPLERILAERPQAVILSGGPRTVFEPGAPKPDLRLYDAGLPLLGICYGMQLLVQRFGGEVCDAGNRSYGADRLVRAEGSLFRGLANNLAVWMSHSTSVVKLPPGWRSLAATGGNPHVAVSSPDERLLGVQFHPEVVHTPRGMTILDRFLDAAGVARDWTAEASLERTLADVRERVGTGRVLVGVSGGVDSSALALLLARA